jgi:hypothetical protein
VNPPLRAPDGSALLTSAGAAQFPTADSTRRYYGTSTPTREIGFSNTFTLFRYFRLYGLLDYKGGHKIFNQKERNRCQSNDNCWRTNNPVARFPQTAADTVLFKELAVYRAAGPSPEWIQKADFFKLREVSLTVDVPNNLVRRAGAASASFVLSGRNLALWSELVRRSQLRARGCLRAPDDPSFLRRLQHLLLTSNRDHTCLTSDLPVASLA